MAIRKFKHGDYESVVSLDHQNKYIDYANKMKTHEYPEELKSKLITHHIVPVHDGGTDDPENKVKLSFRDHVYAHLLLAEVYGEAVDDMTYKMMSGMEENVYLAVRKLGALATHALLKSRGENFWNRDFQTEMSRRAVEKDRAQGFKDRSRGGKIAGDKRWANFLTTPETKWLFSYNDQEIVCVFDCSHGGEIMKELQQIYPNKEFKRVSPLLSGSRKKAYNWSVKKVVS